LNGLIASIVNVKLVQKSMKDRTEDQARDTDQGKPTVESIKRSEQLAGARLHWIHRAHPAENHRRVQERIDPQQVFEIVVAANAERE
jgi:hypothetical protein